MSDEVKDIDTLAKLMKLQLEIIKERFDKNDTFLEKKFDKLDEKMETFEEKLGEKNVDIALLKKETESTTKNWGSFVGLIAGSLASIIVTVIMKALGV